MVWQKMGALIHTTPADFTGDGRSVLAAMSPYARVGSIFPPRKFLRTGRSLHPAFHSRAFLGFSQCPCCCGNFSQIGRSITRYRINKNRPSSLHYQSRRNLVSQSKLPAHDDDSEKSSSEASQASSESEISPSVVDASEEGGDSGSSRGQQPRIPYGLVTALASLGFVETSYLTWAKISGTSVACSVGGSCTDVLDSSYATVFGIPLALIGTLAYGAIGVLGGIRLLSSSSDTWAEEEKWIRWLALGVTTSMGAASVYFMYILIVKLEGASCAYCASSAVLSLSLLLSSLRGFTTKDMTKIAGLQVAAGVSVVLALSVAYDGADAAQDLDLPPVEPAVLTSSSPRVISLAKHLQSVGARMYGAFWCSHCHEQKEMFGREAMQYVVYVECYPEGYRKGIPIAKACDAANIQGFPTWVIKGQILSGEQELDDLAKASDFDQVEY